MKLQDMENHVILPEVVSKEPLGPWVRTGRREHGSIPGALDRAAL
jgi:hypothetical protein